MLATLGMVTDCYLTSSGGMSRAAPSLDRSRDVGQGCRAFTTTNGASGTGIFVSTYDMKRNVLPRRRYVRGGGQGAETQRWLLVVVLHS